MASELETCLARAAQARADAEAATLDNVRDRCLRAETAWTHMARRAALIEANRARVKAEKDAAVAAPTVMIG